MRLPLFLALWLWGGVACGGDAPRAPDTPDGWAQALRKGSVRERLRAAQALAKMGPQAFPVLEDLIAGLRDESKYVRTMCATAIGRIGPRAHPAVPELVRALRQRASVSEDMEGGAHYAAYLNGLAGIGPAAREALPAVREALEDPKWRGRNTAAIALWRITEEPETSRRVLERSFAGTDGDARLSSIACLGMMGTAAAESAGALRRLVAAGSDYEKVQAAAALYKVTGKSGESVGALTQLLKSPVAAARRSAARSLAEIGAAGAPARKALEAALLDTDSTVRREVERALRAIGK